MGGILEGSRSVIRRMMGGLSGGFEGVEDGPKYINALENSSSYLYAADDTGWCMLCEVCALRRRSGGGG